ncbi:P-loop containing nucleoside triphosphate hydrolase protein [Desarmillaria tabescens]|uniref:P-loop containing nucleoside triphosphate hydrolase protein n=1 Tax=Armillaria tabescens TaxID=1929756 RepID=A0AA39NET1_ARMTA|nr:P-loop containing nucleoside triphosphate hydrolase protein [Desarmillaria tabescens]KAK0464301.1 P-loop containing nucleoside triphosphate hydrolase protein [Desarmillaria tabescens]
MAPAEETPQTTTTKPLSPRTLIARYDQYFDPFRRSFSTTLRRTSKPKKPKTKSSKKPVLVVRRLIDSKGRHNGTEVDIMSTGLRDIIAEINNDVLGFRIAGDTATVEPEVFFHSRMGLIERLVKVEAEEPLDEALVTDLKTALNFMEEHFSRIITELPVLLDHCEIVFEHLWALLLPNTYVYHRIWLTEQDQILRARTFSIEYTSNGTPFGNVVCDIVSNDGESFGIARVELQINYFKGSRQIQDLEVYPLAFHPEKEALQTHAISRGKKYTQLTESSYCEVRGPAIVEVDEKPRKFNAHGHLMIDPAAFRTYEANADYLNIPVRKGLDRDSLTDEQHMICNPVALGFCFGTKTWGGFAMDRLKDIIWSDETFNSLVLGDTQKILIHALIKQHVVRAAQYDDIVPGKGRGLIGLLSGNPGCGKTLTAEAVAEITRRPLYVVSAGELGTQPPEVDRMLTRILELAHRWNAVLLLDEAEVFLQERSTNDITRNALVSIFLRQLEYYQGILILTTNLAGQCDRALESRIHFCISYPDLDYDARMKIWKMFLAKGALDPARGMSDFCLDRLARLRLNGRQIKNAVASAQSIALNCNAPLSPEHVDKVLEVLSEREKARKGCDSH